MGRPRKYSLNENYFENIDSNSKAYVLGFIYADGSINKSRGNYLQIGLSKNDFEILEYIKKELEYNGNLYEYYKETTDKYYSILSISSKKITNDLIKLGVVVNKTYKSKKFPLYNKQYEGSFLRGFFDGDGSIYLNNYRKNKEYCVSFSGNYDVLSQLKLILLNYNISSSKIRFRRNNKESCMLEIKGNNNIEKIYNLMYSDNGFYLKRKRNRFDDFKENLNGLDRRHIKSEIINEIKSLYLNGYRQFEIANMKNMPKSSIRTIIQRLRKYGEIK